MTQPRPSIAQFQMVYYGTSANEDLLNASHLASVLIGMNSLVDGASRVVNRGNTSPKLSVHGIRYGSIEIQFAIDLAWNIDVQTAVNLAFTAEDFKKVLFGGAGIGGVFTMFKLLRGRQPKKITDHDSQIVRIELDEGAPFLGHRIAVELFKEPEIRKSVQRIVRPVVELNLDRLVIRDGNDDLVEVSRGEAYQMDVAERQQREVDMVDAVREELRTGFAGVNERIDSDIGSWALLGKLIGQMKDRLDEIDKRLP